MRTLFIAPPRIAPSLYDQAQISQPTRRYQDLGRHCPLARGSEKQHAYTIASPQPVELRRGREDSLEAECKRDCIKRDPYRGISEDGV